MKKITLLLLLLACVLNAQTVTYTVDKASKTGNINIAPIVSLVASWADSTAIYNAGYTAGVKSVTCDTMKYYMNGWNAGVKSMIDTISVELTGRMKAFYVSPFKIMIIDTMQVK